jgi:hypothetical protein
LGQRQTDISDRSFVEFDPEQGSVGRLPVVIGLTRTVVPIAGPAVLARAGIRVSANNPIGLRSLAVGPD